MKPRLWCRHKIWSCAAADWQTSRIVGYGWTAREAYDDWKFHCEAAALSAAQP